MQQAPERRRAVLSPSRRLRTDSASLLAAGPVLSKAEGVGEPRRVPEGSWHGQPCMVRLEERDRCWVLLPNKSGALRDTAYLEASRTGAKPGKIQTKFKQFLHIPYLFFPKIPIKAGIF